MERAHPPGWATSSRWLWAGLLGILLIVAVAPLAPDVKITRWKLTALELGVLIAAAAWLCETGWSGKMSWRPSALNLPLLGYAALTAALYATSGHPERARGEFERMLLSVGAFTAAARLGEAWRGRAVSVWLLFSGFAALYGVLQQFGGVGSVMVPHLPWGPFSTFGNRDFFAAYLVQIAPVALGASLASSWRRGGRLAAAAGAGVMYAALLFSSSRAGWIGGLVGLGLFGVLYARDRGRGQAPPVRGQAWWIRRILLGFVVAVGVATFVVATWSNWMRPTARLLIWRDTARMALANPVLGVGLGEFVLHFPKHASAELQAKVPLTQNIVNYAHNEYLEVWAETGAVGLGVLLWLLFALGRTATAAVARAPPSERPIVMGLAAGLLGTLVHNGADVNFRFIVSAVFAWFLAGHLAAYAEPLVSLPILGRVLRTTSRVPPDVLSVVGAASSPPVRVVAGTLCTALVAFVAVRLVPIITEPYRAQETMKAQKDFFSEQVADPNKAVADLQALIRKHPGDSDSWYKLGWVHAKQRRYAEAVKAFTRSAEMRPTAGAYNNIGNIYYQMLQQYDQAIVWYRKAIALAPEKADSHFNLGHLYFSRGRMKEAEEELRKVLTLDKQGGQRAKAVIMLKQMVE